MILIDLGLLRAVPASLFCLEQLPKLSCPNDRFWSDTMTLLDDRRHHFEKRFVHDEELRFKATARRNKLLGLWTAERLGKFGSDAETYANSVIHADLEEPGDADIIGKVTADLRTAGLPEAEPEVQQMLDLLMTRAVAENKSSA